MINYVYIYLCLWVRSGAIIILIQEVIDKRTKFSWSINIIYKSKTIKYEVKKEIKNEEES
jgi:hypothetical protein